MLEHDDLRDQRTVGVGLRQWWWCGRCREREGVCVVISRQSLAVGSTRLPNPSAEKKRLGSGVAYRAIVVR